MALEDALLAELGAGIFEDWRSRLPDLKLPTFPNGYERRDLKTITAISVHHAAGNPTATPPVIDRQHKSTSGPDAPNQSPGIAYHVYIYLVGKVWKVAYVGDIGTIRWHTKSNNFYTFGICAGGNYEQDNPPWAVVNLLQRVISVVKAFLDRPLDVKQHRAFPNTSTSCPGKLGDGDVWQAVLQVPAPRPLHEFVLGFKSYAAAHPEVGTPIEGEFYGTSQGQQVSIQRTTTGVLLYDSQHGVKFYKT